MNDDDCKDNPLRPLKDVLHDLEKLEILESAMEAVNLHFAHFPALQDRIKENRSEIHRHMELGISFYNGPFSVSHNGRALQYNYASQRYHLIPLADSSVNHHLG